MSTEISLDYDAPIHIPVRALTPDGFREWSHSPDFPEHVELSFLRDAVYIEINDLTSGGGCAISVPTSARDFDGFCAWATSDDFPQQGRISFINEEIVFDMSPEEVESHNKVKTAISSRLFLLSREDNLGTFYSDRILLRNDAVGLSREPDAMFVKWESFQSNAVRLVPRRGHSGEFVLMEGTPDWVMEVVSRHSRSKDTRALRENYHRAGIAEYWLVDALGEEIDFRILNHHPDGYVEAPAKEGWHPSQVFARNFRLERTRDPIGFWEYTLHVFDRI